MQFSNGYWMQFYFLWQWYGIYWARVGIDSVWGRAMKIVVACLIFSSPEIPLKVLKKKQTVISVQNGPLILSSSLLLMELFLGRVIDRSGDFKLPPQMSITSLEELSIIWVYCGKNPPAGTCLSWRNFALKLYSCNL